MSRQRRWSVACSVVLVAAGMAMADDSPQAAAKVGEVKWGWDRALTITPRGEPEPALKYRLLPLTTDLKDGNAVPIYLRLKHEQNDETRKDLMNTPQQWINLPLNEVPLAEAHKYLNRFSRYLQQLDYGARRKSADWNYTIEQPDPIGILLPDMNQMRGMAPILVTRMRVQIADGDFPEAARSIETGFGFSRHVANGPFILNGLVGCAIAQIIAGRIPDWIERPDAPNLYWALTALPRPLIDLRCQMEFEQRMPELQFPDFAELNRPRSPAEWDAALKQFRAEAKRVDPFIKGGWEAKMVEETPPPTNPDEPAAKSPDLAAAGRFLAERRNLSRAQIGMMPAAQVLLLYIAGTFSDHRDDLFKLTYLPYSQGHERVATTTNHLHAAAGGEGTRLAKLLLPAVVKIINSQNRLERHIALLRTIEALRMHAAANNGQLPDALDQVTIAPVPLDPGTGKPFEYRRDGLTATLSSRVPGEPLETNGYRYRLTIRAK